MPQKGSTPWSTRTVAEGGTDSPIGDLVPVPDSAQPVIDAGFIDETGKWRLTAAADDSVFTFQDPSQALGPGASIFIDSINMLNHDIIILAILDSSGNDINIDVNVMTGAAAPTDSPYNAKPFTDSGMKLDNWLSNDPGDLTGNFQTILDDSDQPIYDSWSLFKIAHLRGTLMQVRLRSNEAADAGTISTAFLRLV